MKLDELFDFDNPVTRSRLLRYFWVISLAMLILGWAMILLFWNGFP
jgi:hypothetical protein